MIGLVVKASIILLLTLATTRLLRRTRASIRHALLVAAMAALALLPLAVALSPTVDLPVLPARERDLVETGPEIDQREAATSSTASSHVISGSADIRDRTTQTTSPPLRISLTGVLIIVWAAGAAVILLRLAIGIARVHRMRRSAVPLLEAYPVVASLMGTTGRPAVEVVIHEQTAGPFTCGAWRATIVLPTEARSWPPAALRCALRHELEHVTRRDWAAQMAAHAVVALYWFHPLAWMVYQRLRLEAEHACDDAVVASEENMLYAEQLVDLARTFVVRPAVGMIGMAHRSDLAARINAVLDVNRPRGRTGALRAVLVTMSAITSLVAFAPLRLVAASSGSPAGSAAVAQRPAEDAGSPREDAQTPSLDERSPVRDADSPTVALAAPPPAGRAREQRSPRAGRLERMLVEAADAGDLRDVSRLLDAGANINAAVDGDGSALIVAAREGHIAIVRLLLERGADVNLAVEGDGAPLIMAAREGHLAIAELLLDRGADVDRIVASDENALIQASGAGHLAMVQLLVARGASVNARTWVEQVWGGRDGGEWRSPLSMALKGGHQQVAAFLRANGAVE
jgi:beta-lactamase regulating signal transducer with metallopeptidase domain